MPIWAWWLLAVAAIVVFVFYLLWATQRAMDKETREFLEQRERKIGHWPPPR